MHAEHVQAVVVAQRAFQGHRLITLEGKFVREAFTVPTGWYVVETDQALGRFAFSMLEPEGDDGLVTWGFFGEELAARDEECPVLAVDWARSYHNVTLHARQAVVESDRLAATPVRAVANARLTTPVAAVEKGEDRHEDDREDKREDKHEEKQTATPSTSSATPNTTNARSTTPNAVDESANAVDPSPLVRRTSTADPWRIRAATVVDGDANTPSSSAGPGRTRRQVPPVDVKKAVVETELSRPGPVDVSHEVQEELSQLILALHLDVVQMHEASSAEIRALRQEVAALKELLECQAKPSGDVWGI